jgi:hypothetical protein
MLPRRGDPPERIGPFVGGSDATLKAVGGQGGGGAGVWVNHADAVVV